MTDTIFKPAQEEFLQGVDDDEHAEMLETFGVTIPTRQLQGALHWYKANDYEKSAKEVKRILRQRNQE